MALQINLWPRPVAGSELGLTLRELARKWESEAIMLENWPCTPTRDFQIAQLKRCARELRASIKKRQLVNAA